MNENPTILIVDDDMAGRESLKGVLFSQGYDLIDAENGKQAIEMAKEYIPDLILLDVMMAEMDGFEVCRRLRSDHLLAEIPILMITALDDRGSRLAGIEAGADDFISKPFDRMELRSRVRTVVRLNRYRGLVLERARFVWVIENDQDAYLILDENGAINYANTAAQILFTLPPGDTEQELGIFLEKIKNGFLLVPPKRWEYWPVVEDAEEPLYLVRQQGDQEAPHWYEIHLLDLPWVTKKQRLVRAKEVTNMMSLQLETWSFQAAANHKLITPLSNIMLSIQVVKMLAKQHSLPDLNECVGTMESGLRRLESEIRDILQYIYAPNMAQSGDLVAPLELESLVAQTAQELAIDEIHFSADFSLLNGKRLGLSSRAVQVVLWEILENAKKFHPQLAPRVEVSLAAQPSGRAVLKIGDDGVTLSPQNIAGAFKPYFQGERCYSGEVTGMGLGLPTVAALVWQSGGDIELYNRPDGPGVVVELRLPLM